MTFPRVYDMKRTPANEVEKEKPMMVMIIIIMTLIMTIESKTFEPHNAPCHYLFKIRTPGTQAEPPRQSADYTMQLSSVFIHFP